LGVERWALNSSADPRPVVASFCATFLKPEMLHIYRQITSLERVRPIVLAQKLENARQFPFDRVYTVGKPATHFLRRFWFRQLLDEPWQISRMELDALRQILTKSDAQLLHIYFGHIAVHLLPLIRTWSKPSIVSFHGADVLVDMNKPAYHRATEEMLGAVEHVLVRSESLRRAVVDLGCNENKIDIVRTGIPLHEFPLRERTFPENGEWRLLQACRLIEKKGLSTTLRAFAEFNAVHPRSTITIAGEGPLLEDLQALSRALKIDNRVSFPGFVSQEKLREMFYASHIFLHPSETARDGNQEGVPNSMLEAMASGLPVLATNHGGIPEAIENGISGVLVAERDHAALARALLDTVQDRHLMAKLGRIGSQSVAEKFDQRAQVRRLEEVYLQIIAGRGD
jgi:colanic acid/amylovoran biosynthesis glycosyltransferase